MKRKRYTPEFKSQIVLEVLKEEKTMSEIASSHGIHVNQIRQWRNAFMEQMPQMCAKENKIVDQMKADYEQRIENLYAEVGRIATQLSWLKKNLPLRSRAERIDMIGWDDAELPIATQAELLGLN